VGTVFLAMAGVEGAEVFERHNRWDRATFKQITSQQALELVRRRLLGLPLN
jgi:nicotinamide mononucleotide (NMN) deamidase PncC